MNDFNSLFPDFLNQCLELKTLLMPLAFVFITGGMISSMVTGRRTAGQVLRTIARTLVYVVVLTQLVSWGNLVSQIVVTTVHDTLGADPAQVHAQYNEKLVARKSTDPNAGWWEKLFNYGTSMFESLVSGVLYCVGGLASAILFYAYLIQKFILYLGYALTPLFVGFLAIRSLDHVGKRYLMGLVGVMCWPLGWGVASIMTKGLLDYMTDQSFLVNGTALGAGGYTLQNMMGVATLGLWIIFSTIAAPFIIQRVITSGIQAGSALAGSFATAALAAGTTGATGTAAVASSGRPLLASAVGTAAGAMALVSTSAEAGNAGAGLTSLGHYLPHKKSSGSESEPQDWANDLTGDKAVKALLERSKRKAYL